MSIKLNVDYTGYRAYDNGIVMQYDLFVGGADMYMVAV